MNKFEFKNITCTVTDDVAKHAFNKIFLIVLCNIIIAACKNIRRVCIKISPYRLIRSLFPD